MGEARRRKLALAEPKDWGALLRECPYQTLLGLPGVIPPGITPADAMQTLGPKLGATVIVLDGDPEAGRLVLLASNRSRFRAESPDRSHT